MKLIFNFTEKDGLAFTERYLRGSKSHQRMRAKVRWMFPLFLAVVVCYYAWRDGFSWIFPLVCGVPAFAWWLLYPLRFDSRVRAEARKQMRESSHARSFGTWEVTLLDEHLVSTSPLGSSTFLWTAVDRVEMDAEYLTIFLSGAAGYPIPVVEVGAEAARQAYDFVSARIAANRLADSPAPSRS